MRAETIKVPYIGPSLNSIYAGIHWSKRKKHADAAHMAVKVSCKGINCFSKPVLLDFQPLHRGRGYDVSNYAYTVKLLEDGLVQCGILEDDTNKFVRGITIHPPIKLKKPDENCMVVTIVESENENK